MKQDITLIQGHQGKPIVILIHGLGMDKRIWVTPEKARILGGMFPLNVLLSKEPEPGIIEILMEKKSSTRQF